MSTSRVTRGALAALALVVAGCRSEPAQPQFPKAHRDVAPIVSDAFSTEDARDRLGEAEEVMTLSSVRPGMSVADVGAGEGYYTVRLARVVGRKGRVLAEDIVPAARDALSDRIQRENIENVAVKLGTPANPTLPAASFDRIFLVHMYHEVQSPYEFLWHLRDPSRIKFESGAFRTGVMPGWARPTLTLMSLVFIGLAWWWANARRRNGGDDDVVYALAPLSCVLALLIFAPILSPQYIVWMLPFAAILTTRHDRLIGGLTLAITIVTTISYITVPSAAEGALYGTIPVLTRNLLLVALFIVTLQELSGLRRVAPQGIRSSASS
jgi:SAM-dependent methyltransferase